MSNGYTSKILRVDLNREQVAEEYLSEDTSRLHIGGAGLGAKLLYGEVPPGVAWNAPQNRLILAAGPLNGSRVAGSGSFCVVTKGPLTNGATSSQANGYFGAYLKFSGFDAIVVQGSAKRWLYLYIHDGVAELRDAEHLQGKDTWEIEDLIKAELGKTERGMSVFGIGPAGENLVKFAAIVGDHGHVAGHNGTGAVMGSKRLKAVAIARGTTAVLAKDKDKLATLSKKMITEFKQTPSYKWGTSMLYSGAALRGSLAVKNLTTNLFPEHAKFMGENYRNRFELKPSPCWACPAHHCHIVKVTEGPYAGYVGEEPEYEAWAAWSSLIGQTDLGAGVMLSNLTDRLGLEVNEAGWVIGFVMECYERGLLSQKETDGLQMTWGNVEAVRAMLHKIAHRQGFGDLLAEGVMRSAQRLGGEAVDIGIYLKKGNAPRTHDLRGAKWGEMFDTATSSTGIIETGTIAPTDPFSPEEVATAVAKEKGVRMFVDSLVMCMLPTMTYTSSKINHLVDMLNAVTGWDYSPEEAMRSGLRTVNLLRAFNIRHGVTPEVEVPSARQLSAPVDGPAQGKSIAAYWEQMLDIFYKETGWDRRSGKPLPQTLQRLGLAHIIPDIWANKLG